MISYFVDAPFLDTVVIGNVLSAYIDGLIIFTFFGCAFFILEKMFLQRLKRAAEKTTSDIDDVIIEIVESIKPPFYWFVAFYLGLQMIIVHSLVSQGILIILTIWVVWQIVQAVQLFVTYVTQKALEKQGADQNTQSAISLISSIVKFVLWIIAILLVLSNLGINVTSLIAGVGIGGIAIAFAVQGILEDLFSSFSLYFDKPFMIGDTIEVDGKKGIVKKIGIKTTRLKSLATGEEIIVSNKELTSARVHNYHRMDRRRVSFSLGVTYDTPTEKIKKIPEMIENIITQYEDVSFERTHFRSFDDSALSFAILYFVESKSYDVYLDVHQKILLAIREEFEKNGIEFAFPTQTVHVQNDK